MLFCFSSDKYLKRDLSYQDDFNMRKWKEQGFYIEALERALQAVLFCFTLFYKMCNEYHLQTLT